MNPAPFAPVLRNAQSVAGVAGADPPAAIARLLQR